MPEIVIVCTSNKKTKIYGIPCSRADSGLGASPAAPVISSTALLCCCFYYPKFKAKKPSSARIGNLLNITQTPPSRAWIQTQPVRPPVSSLSTTHAHIRPLDKTSFLTPSKTRSYKYMYSCCEHRQPITRQNLSSPGCRCCKYQLLTHSNLQNLVVILAVLGLRLSPGKFTRDLIRISGNQAEPVWSCQMK